MTTSVGQRRLTPQGRDNIGRTKTADSFLKENLQGKAPHAFGLKGTPNNFPEIFMRTDHIIKIGGDLFVLNVTGTYQKSKTFQFLTKKLDKKNKISAEFYALARNFKKKLTLHLLVEWAPNMH